MPQSKSIKMIEQILDMAAAGHKMRKIARALNISRNTVRRYLRDAKPVEAAPAVNDVNKESLSPSPSPTPLPAWALAIAWDQVVSARRRGVALNQLFDEYQPAISYSRFCRVLRSQLQKPAATALRLEHTPGERAQIDFADGLCLIDPLTGALTKTQLFCGVLPFSSYTFAEFVRDQKLPTFIRCHENMWAFFSGVTPYVVIDNLKAGLSKAHRYDPETNPTYCDYGNHAGFAVLPARPYTPRDKAAVEAAIGVLQRTFYQKYRDYKFYALEELNQKLREFLAEFNAREMREKGVSRSEMFLTEKSKLLPLPIEPYEIVDWRQAKVHPDCCVQVLYNFYSVPFRYVGQHVRVKVSSRLVEVFSSDGERLSCHQRLTGKGKVEFEPAHHPPKRMQEQSFEVQKAKTLAARVGPKTKELIELQLGGDRPLRHLRRVQGILRLIDAGVSHDSMEYASSQALTFCRYQVAYIKRCAENHAAIGSRPRLAVPRRDPNTIHLHGEANVRDH